MRTAVYVLLPSVLVLWMATLAFADWMGGPGYRTGGWGGGMCRMMDVSPQPVDPATLPEPRSLGADLLQNQCTQCHGLVAPGQHAAQDWPAIVERMDRRMSMMAQGRMGMRRHAIEALTPAEKQALLDYLRRHSFQAAKPEILEKQGSAAESYIDVCSRCHALPDPQAHAAQEWPAVVDRMAKNMTNLGMDPMPEGQREDIVVYLQKEAQ